MAGTTYPQERNDSALAAGLATFAGFLMITIGIYQLVVGLTALLRREFYVVTTDYAFEIDATTWGWIHLLFGAVLGVAGWRVIAGELWARIVGIVLAVLSAIVNFAFLPYYPLWAMLIIALDVFVIWALCIHNSRTASTTGFTD